MRPDDFVRLLDRHGPALVLYARQWCDTPEDVVQEAFLKLMSLRQPPRAVVPYLYRIVRNAALDARKAANCRRSSKTFTCLCRSIRPPANRSATKSMAK